MAGNIASHLNDLSIDAVNLATISASDIAAWIEYDARMNAEAPPTPFEIARLRITSAPDFIVVSLFVARDRHGAVVADGRAVVTRTPNNLHICRAHISVLPDYRRRGIARQLLRRLVGVAEDGDRTALVGWIADDNPHGAGFAARIGAQPVERRHLNRLSLATLDRAMVDRWIDEGPRRACGYSLHAIDGPYPDDLIDAMVELRHLVNTAPRDLLDMEAPRLDAAQMRALDLKTVKDGIERWSLIARHDPTGAIAGFTEVTYHPNQPASMRQWGTVVQPAHRGLGLGKWLKATMLERIVRERPTIEEVVTGTADTNDAMLRINRALGFEPFRAATAWQVSVAHARESSVVADQLLETTHPIEETR